MVGRYLAWNPPRVHSSYRVHLNRGSPLSHTHSGSLACSYRRMDLRNRSHSHHSSVRCCPRIHRHNSAAPRTHNATAPYRGIHHWLSNIWDCDCNPMMDYQTHSLPRWCRRSSILPMIPLDLLSSLVFLHLLLLFKSFLFYLDFAQSFLFSVYA